MNRRSGFTLIELLITMTIMAILLTLAVVNLRSSQANARDEERKTDVGTIAQQLEVFYDNGSDTTTTTGEYPPTIAMDSESDVKATLRDIDANALRDPSTPAASTISLTVASTTSVPSLASLNSGKTYIYQPIDTTGALCTTAAQECRKFNLYYTLETNPTVITVTSKHQ